MATSRLIRAGFTSGVLIFLNGCISAGEAGINYDNFYCNVDAEWQVPLAKPPIKAEQFRNIARLHPNNRHRFGPPPRQQAFSGRAWDQRNEYWFVSDDGELYLYVNTDDFYAYYWRFESASKATLVGHGLLNCGCHFCSSRSAPAVFSRPNGVAVPSPMLGLRGDRG